MEEAELLEDAVAATSAAVLNYRACAGQIDAEVESQNEDRRLSLDDLPYGEEMVRTKELPLALKRAARLLDGEKVTAQAFNEARDIVLDAQTTLDDCTPLPPDMLDQA
ncbi:hypothetical protein D9M69_703340 [compost metagenome]